MNDVKKDTKIETSIIVKSLNTLMGIISGLVSDGELNDKELLFLKTWCNENSHIAKEYPANIIFRRIHEVLLDNIITPEEREHLLHELVNLSGNDFSNTGSALPEHISSIFDDDPTVIFADSEFVFTGAFIFGTRAACEGTTLKRGASVKSYVTQNTNYLVIGARSSPAWITDNFGRKIQKAAEMVNSGEYNLSIIREVDWTMSLK